MSGYLDQAKVTYDTGLRFDAHNRVVQAKMEAERKEEAAEESSRAQRSKKRNRPTSAPTFYNGHDLTLNPDDRIISQRFIQEGIKKFKLDPQKRLAQNVVCSVGPTEGALDAKKARNISHIFSVTLVGKKTVASDQYWTGRCWLFAMLNTLRHHINKTFQLENFEFSPGYLQFYDLLEKSNCFLLWFMNKGVHQNIFSDHEVVAALESPTCDGGYANFALSLIKKYGLVPYHAMPEVRHSLDSGRIRESINQRLRSAAEQMKTIHSRERKAEKEAITQKILENRVIENRISEPLQKYREEASLKEATEQTKRSIIRKKNLLKNLIPSEFEEQHLNKVIKQLANIVIEHKKLTFEEEEYEDFLEEFQSKIPEDEMRGLEQEAKKYAKEKFTSFMSNIAQETIKEKQKELIQQKREELIQETRRSISSEEMEKLISEERDRVTEGELNRLILIQIKHDVMRKVRNDLLTYFGPPPQNFNWSFRTEEGEHRILNDLTPTSFLSLLPHWKSENQVVLGHMPVRNHPELGVRARPYYRQYQIPDARNITEGMPCTFINVPIDAILKLVAQSIREALPVWFAADVGKGHNREYFTLDESLEDRALLFDPERKLDKERRFLFRQTTMNHAMVFTGYTHRQGERDSILRAQVENSWGGYIPEPGYNGFYSASEEWIRRNAGHFVFDKALLSPEILEALGEDPIVLEPTDPYSRAFRVS